MGDGPLSIFGLVIIGAVALLLVGIVAFIAKLYQKVLQGQALIVNKPNGTKVFFTGAIVVPLVHRSEYMDRALRGSH